MKGSHPAGTGDAVARAHLCGDEVAILKLGVQQALGVGVQELHGKVHARRLAPGDGQVAGLGRPRSQHHRVRARAHIPDVDVASHVRIDDEAHALLGLHAGKVVASADVPNGRVGQQ